MTKINADEPRNVIIYGYRDGVYCRSVFKVILRKFDIGDGKVVKTPIVHHQEIRKKSKEFGYDVVTSYSYYDAFLEKRVRVSLADRREVEEAKKMKSDEPLKHRHIDANTMKVVNTNGDKIIVRKAKGLKNGKKKK